MRKTNATKDIVLIEYTGLEFQYPLKISNYSQEQEKFPAEIILYPGDFKEKFDKIQNIISTIKKTNQGPKNETEKSEHVHKNPESNFYLLTELNLDLQNLVHMIKEEIFLQLIPFMNVLRLVFQTHFPTNYIHIYRRDGSLYICQAIFWEENNLEVSTPQSSFEKPYSFEIEHHLSHLTTLLIQNEKFMSIVGDWLECKLGQSFVHNITDRWNIMEHLVAKFGSPSKYTKLTDKIKDNAKEIWKDAEKCFHTKDGLKEFKDDKEILLGSIRYHFPIKIRIHNIYKQIFKHSISEDKKLIVKHMSALRNAVYHRSTDPYKILGELRENNKSKDFMLADLLVISNNFFAFFEEIIIKLLGWDSYIEQKEGVTIEIYSGKKSGDNYFKWRFFEQEPDAEFQDIFKCKDPEYSLRKYQYQKKRLYNSTQYSNLIRKISKNPQKLHQFLEKYPLTGFYVEDGQIVPESFQLKVNFDEKTGFYELPRKRRKDPRFQSACIETFPSMQFDFIINSYNKHIDLTEFKTEEFTVKYFSMNIIHEKISQK